MDPDSPPLDPEVLQTLRNLSEPGQPDVLQEVLRLFLDDAPARIDAIEQAAGAGDGVALQRAAHTMKGAAGAVGASRLQQASRDLEDLAKAGDWAGVSRAVTSLRRAYDEVTVAMSDLLG